MDYLIEPIQYHYLRMTLSFIMMYNASEREKNGHNRCQQDCGENMSRNIPSFNTNTRRLTEEEEQQMHL